MMFSDVAFDISKKEFDEEIFGEYKKKVGAQSDLDLNAENLKEVSQQFLDHFKEHAGREFPSDPLSNWSFRLSSVQELE